MYILLYLAVVAITYVASFKENFTQEHVNKVALALSIVTVIVVLLSILSSAVGSI